MYRIIGWQPWVKDGELAGTSGQSKRLEAIKIKLNSNEIPNTNISYQTHIQDIGWQDWKSNGDLSGTSGQLKRLEAIRIKLDNPNYTVRYRVHVQDIGWQDWKSDGELAGTSGQCLRLEAIQIEIIKKSNFEIEMKYVRNSDNTVTATMCSNNQLADTKPTWNLSSDKMSYSKTFSENMNYSTQVQDIYGNTKEVQIQITRYWR